MGPRRPAPAGQRHSKERSRARTLPVRRFGVGAQEVVTTPELRAPPGPASVLSSPPTVWDRTPGIDRKLLAERSRQARGKKGNMLFAPRVTLTGPKPRTKPAAPGAAAAVAAGAAGT